MNTRPFALVVVLMLLIAQAALATGDCQDYTDSPDFDTLNVTSSFDDCMTVSGDYAVGFGSQWIRVIRISDGQQTQSIPHNAPISKIQAVGDYVFMHKSPDVNSSTIEVYELSSAGILTHVRSWSSGGNYRVQDFAVFSRGGWPGILVSLRGIAVGYTNIQQLYDVVNINAWHWVQGFEYDDSRNVSVSEDGKRFAITHGNADISVYNNSEFPSYTVFIGTTVPNYGHSHHASVFKVGSSHYGLAAYGGNQPGVRFGGATSSSDLGFDTMANSHVVLDGAYCTSIDAEDDVLYAGLDNGRVMYVQLNNVDSRQVTEIYNFGSGEVHVVQVEGNHLFALKQYSLRRIAKAPTHFEPFAGVLPGLHGQYIEADGRLAYVFGGTSFSCVDLLNPDQPNVLSTNTFSYKSTAAIAKHGNTVYGVTDYNTIRIFDVSNPHNVNHKSDVSVGGSMVDAVAKDGYLYVAGYDRLRTYSLASPHLPALVDEIVFDPNGGSGELEFVGDYLYLSQYTFGYRVLDVSTPDSPSLAYTKNYGGNGWGDLIYDAEQDIVYLGRTLSQWPDYGRIYSIDVSSPTQPVELATADLVGAIYDVQVTDNGVYASTQHASPSASRMNYLKKQATAGELDLLGYTDVDDILYSFIVRRHLWCASYNGDYALLGLEAHCQPVEITSSSVSGGMTGINPNTWTFEWDTDVATDPELDKVMVYDGPHRNPDCYIGTETFLPGQSTVTHAITESAGVYHHTMAVVRGDCAPNCVFNYDVFSGRDGGDDASVEHQFKVKICAQRLPLKDNSEISSIQVRSPYPNPFNPTTRVEFYVPAAGTAAQVELFDIKGRRVATQVLETQPGWNEFVWHGRDDQGRVVSSGVYYMRMQIGSESFQDKLILMK